jgi:TldD protein
MYAPSVSGSWGFASVSNMTKDGLVKATLEAVRIAKAARTAQKRPVELAPAPVVKGTWMTPVKRDPLEAPLEEKVALLFAANEAALKTPGTRFVTSGFQLLREIKTYVNSEGTETTQTSIRVGPSWTATASGKGNTERINSTHIPC